jgi:drug/metabolite transporter (DMT)-like permease
MRVRPVVAFVALSVVWGSAFAAVRVGTTFFPPVLYAALCFGVAGVVMLVGARLRYARWLPASGDARRAVGVIAVLMVVAYDALFFVGQRSTPSAVGAIILSFVPVVTAILAVLLLRERRFGPPDAVGVGLGVVGVLLVVDPPVGAVLGGDALPRLLILGAACATALGSVLVERLAPRDPFPLLLAWGMTLGAAGLFAVSVLLGEVAPVDPSLAGVLAVLYLGLVVNVGGYLLYFSLLFGVGAFETNLINYALPLTAAAWGAVVFGETVESGALVGFLVIALGFGVIKRAEVRSLVGTRA